MKLLYATWDGPDSNYLESLFFPLFEALRPLGVETHVVQFSWDVRTFSARVQNAARSRNVGYEVHEVPRRPLRAATLLGIGFGAAVLARSARRIGAEALMPRSHIPGAMALIAQPLLRIPLVWDSDGLMPDERADFGGWSRAGGTYRLFRGIERRLFAHRVLTRTEAAKRLLIERGATDVVCVPNGKSAEEFRPANDEERAQVRAELGLDAKTPLIIYVGSLGPQYRPAEMAQLLARMPDAHFLALTGSGELMRSSLTAAGVTRFTVKRVEAHEVARFIRAADAGLSFREPTLSMRGVCPLKVVEYLLSGVPIVTNRGVGDLDALGDAGISLPDFSSASLDAAARSITQLGAHNRVAARQLGLSRFSLEAAARGYAVSLSRSEG